MNVYLDPKNFQIWESDSCSNSGDHPSKRNSGLLIIKQWHLLKITQTPAIAENKKRLRIQVRFFINFWYQFWILVNKRWILTDSTPALRIRGHLCFLSAGCKGTPNLLSDIIQLVRSEIGPVAAFKEGAFVQRLPKTRSGKIPRATLQALCNGKPYKVALSCFDCLSETYIELGFVWDYIEQASPLSVNSCCNWNLLKTDAF